jgi:TatD DNase family protein
LIDTHCHLDDSSYDNDIELVIANAKKNGVLKILIPGADINDLPKAQKLSKKYENIFYSVGIHPYNIEQYNEEVLIKYSKDSKCLSVGECGLDYFRLSNDENLAQEEIKKQKEVFKLHIELAIKLDKPLILHIRDNKDNFNASCDVIDIVKDYIKNNKSNTKIRGVLHCFNAYNGLLTLSEYGFYFGIGGVLTFKNAKTLQDIIKQIPKDKLLLETDAPYLTPHPFRGKRNEPKYTALVLEKISSILQIDKQELDKLSTKNANALFGF